MNKLGLAISIAAKAHEDQVDKGGHPYILHPMRVMNSVAHLGEEYMIAAILHDVVEDTDVSIETIRTLFSASVTKAVSLLTKKNNQPYDEYISNILPDDIAREVKEESNNIFGSRDCA